MPVRMSFTGGNRSMKEIVTLGAVLLGGVLALLGTGIQRRLMLSDEERKLRRTKLEEAYVLLDKLREWAKDEMRNTVRPFIAGAKLSDLSTIDCPICAIGMLMRFYRPELLEQTASLEEAVEEFRHGLLDFWLETHQTGKKLPNKRYAQLIGGPFDRLDASRLRLKEAIEGSVQKLLSKGT